MASEIHGARSQPVNIAIAPATASSANAIDFGDSALATKPYSCQTCARRKVKCDKGAPICSSCRKGKLECIYQEPQPRQRKRKLSGDVHERLARYERILSQHGLLPSKVDTSSPVRETSQEPISLNWIEPGMSKTGTLLAERGKSRYVDNRLWRSLGNGVTQLISDDEEEEGENEDEKDTMSFIPDNVVMDPLMGAFMGSQQKLCQYHPTQADALILWKTHIENVEPLCKVLHLPSTFKMVEMVSKRPETASKAEECLLFSVYHFAVFSMTEEDCVNILGNSRSRLLQKYHFATRQALVNASFLKTTEMTILQAFVLFLLACRNSYDPHTLWMLTGVAVRLAQRMGLHRDGETLNLPPFEVQMRRRLFYQVLPLDGAASQMASTGIAIMPDSWDTRPPLNLNDDQIWPGMAEMPAEQNGATEMIFCLARTCIGKYAVRSGHMMQNARPVHFQDYVEAEELIAKVESEVEENYIRYCDIVNPLHFVTIGFVRSAINALRLRVRLPKVKNKTVTDVEKREVLQITMKILDTDAATSANTSLRKFKWNVQPFFAWGSWDSLIFVVTSLEQVGFFSRTEIDAAWSRIEQIYTNHPELLGTRRALHVAIGSATLKAWAANPPSNCLPEPPFIASLRSQGKAKLRSRRESVEDNAPTTTSSADTTTQTQPSSATEASSLFDGLSSSDMGFDTSKDFNLDTTDWSFWDHLLHDDQAQSS